MRFVRAEAYTDGANMPHRQVRHAASGAVLLLVPEGGEPLIYERGRYLGDFSNNVAELCAVELGLALAAREAPELPLTLRTDSQYCQGLFSPGVKSGWRRRAKKNRELVKRVRLMVPPADRFCIEWVRGHDGDTYNERADFIAAWSKENRCDWEARYYLNAGLPALG